MKLGKKKLDDSSAYLRASKPLQAVGGLRLSGEFKRGALRAVVCMLVVVAAGWTLHGVVLHSAPFQVDRDRPDLRIEGLVALQRDELKQIFAEDIGSSLLSVDLDRRLRQLRSIPWVREARVGRVWPDTLTVSVVERTPVAFLRLPGVNQARLVDAEGVILDPRRADDSSLPVLTGIDESMPFEQRLLRIELFESVMGVFSEEERSLGQAVLEIDVSDGANAVVLAEYENQMIRLQMGNRHLRHRLDVFLNYIEAWQVEFGPIESVDLRFEKQVAVQPVKQGRRKG